MCNSTEFGFFLCLLLQCTVLEMPAGNSVVKDSAVTRAAFLLNCCLCVIDFLSFAFLSSDSSEHFLYCPPVSSTGAVVLQPYNRFVSTDVPEAIRYLDCTGSETHISQCQIDQEPQEDCEIYEVAGIACQGS